jgi:hypothetical protein
MTKEAKQTMTKNTIETSRRGRLLGLGTVAAGSLILALGLFSPLTAGAAQLLGPQAVPPPAIPGVAPLPGPPAPASQPANNIGILKASPDRGAAGTKFTLTGTGLPAGKQLSIVWVTSNVSWILDARPDSVDYIGQKEDKNVQVVLQTVTTDARGVLDTTLVAPRDFGAIHDIYAVADGIQYAKGGFLIDRTLKITPLKGPVGTPITVAITGLGSSLYGGSASLWYDGRYAGVITDKWTRGEATVQIRAAGPVGKHTVLVGTGMQFNYLNIAQSPIPWATGGMATFVVTKDAGRPPTRIDWPLPVKPTLDSRTTLTPDVAALKSGTTVSLARTSGVVSAKVDVTGAGLTPGKLVTAEWTSVVGNRVNCTGTCWASSTMPLGSAPAAADGSVKIPFEVPDGLGGWHVVRVTQGGELAAQIPFYVKRSLISVPRRVKAGRPFQVHLKGVGWTQLDNTVAVTYDNGYIGYGCGFNSNGDVVLDLVATGGPGTHLIDIYPLLYPYQPAYAYPPHAAIPFLSFARDFPGLALGYQLPAFRLAITVVA